MIDVTRKHFSSSSTSITSENVLVVRDLDKMSISDFINALEEYDFKNTSRTAPARLRITNATSRFYFERAPKC